MNKTAKRVVIVLCIIAACIGGYKIADKVCYPFVKTKAVLYLCNKYDAKPSEIELIYYRQAEIYWRDIGLPIKDPKWYDFSFEFKYKGRQFFVNRVDGKLYDDYQLDDVQKWCTAWLKDNVDSRIVGIRMDSTNINWYQKCNHKNSKYVITEDDTLDFLNCYSFNSEIYRFTNAIYFYNNSTDDPVIENEINYKLRSKLNLREDYSGWSTMDRNPTIGIDKYEEIGATRFYYINYAK